jgi:hypothetical protein
MRDFFLPFAIGEITEVRFDGKGRISTIAFTGSGELYGTLVACEVRIEYPEPEYFEMLPLNAGAVYPDSPRRPKISVGRIA